MTFKVLFYLINKKSYMLALMESFKICQQNAKIA